MSTKPTNDAPWDTNLTNLIAPTSGHQTDGFSVNEIPSSSEINGQLNRIGLWTTWLLDGDVTFDELAVTGSTTYTGITSVALSASATNYDPLGNGTTTGLHTLRIDPSASTWSISGLVGGVSGRELDIINVDSGLQYFTLVHEAAAATAANRISFPFTVANDEGALTTDFPVRVYPGGRVRLRYDGTLSRWLVIDHSGCRAKRIMSIGAADAVSEGGGSYAAGQWSLSAVVNLNYPVTLPSGSIIHSYAVYHDKNSDAAVTLESYMVQRTDTGGTSTSGPGDSNSGDATGFDVLTEDGSGAGLEERILKRIGYFVQVRRAQSGGASDTIYGCALTYWDTI